MKLPAAYEARVPNDKLTGYLLSHTHPVGSAKAAFFRSLGYNEDNVRLVEAWLEIARGEQVHATVETDYGIKYDLAGNLATPGGRLVRIQTIWIVETGQTAPSFVTAYPLAAEE